MSSHLRIAQKRFFVLSQNVAKRNKVKRFLMRPYGESEMPTNRMSKVLGMFFQNYDVYLLGLENSRDLDEIPKSFLIQHIFKTTRGDHKAS